MGKAPHLPVAEQEERLLSGEGVQRSCSHHAAILCCLHTLHALLSGKSELNTHMLRLGIYVFQNGPHQDMYKNEYLST